MIDIDIQISISERSSGWAINYTWSEVKEVIKIFWFGHTKALIKNIARGTTDPEIDFVTGIELGNNMAPITLVAILSLKFLLSLYF